MAMIVAFWERTREVIHFQSSSSVFLFFFCFCFDNINSASLPFSTGGLNTIGCKLKKKRGHRYAKTKLSKHEKHEQRLSRRLHNSHLSYLFSRHM